MVELLLIKRNSGGLSDIFNRDISDFSSFSFKKVIIKEKVLPEPSLLLMTNLPPIRFISCFDIVVPSPVPPYFLVIELSA